MGSMPMEMGLGFSLFVGLVVVPILIRVIGSPGVFSCCRWGCLPCMGFYSVLCMYVDGRTVYFVCRQAMTVLGGLSGGGSPLRVTKVIMVFLLLLTVVYAFILCNVFGSSGATPGLFNSHICVVGDSDVRPHVGGNSTIFVRRNVASGRNGRLLGRNGIVLYAIGSGLTIMNLLNARRIITTSKDIRARCLMGCSGKTTSRI